MPERQDGGLNRDPIADHVNPSETPHRRHIDQRILHRRIAEVAQLQQQMDSPHGRERIGRTTTLGAGLGIVGLDQLKQCFPRHYLLHLAKKSLPPGALHRRGLLVIIEFDLLGAYEANPRLQLHG